MEIKKYLLFKESYPEVFKKYTWDETQQSWLSEDETGFGFSLSYVEKNWCYRFVLLDTEEEVKEYLIESSFVKKYGPRVKSEPDFACPKCGYHFEDDRDYEGYSGDCPTADFTQKCLCGHLIKITPRMTYEVK